MKTTDIKIHYEVVGRKGAEVDVLAARPTPLKAIALAKEMSQSDVYAEYEKIWAQAFTVKTTLYQTLLWKKKVEQ